MTKILFSEFSMDNFIDTTLNLGINNKGLVIEDTQINVTNYAIFKDDVDINKHLNVTGNITGNNIYGGMHFHDYTGVQIDFTSGNEYYYLWFNQTPHLNGFKANNIGDLLNSSLTTLVDGRYQLIYFAVGSGQNNHQYHVVPFINNTEYDLCETMKKMAAGGDITPMNGNCFIDLKVGQNVSLRIRDYLDTGMGEYYGGNLNLVRVGDSLT